MSNLARRFIRAGRVTTHNMPIRVFSRLLSNASRTNSVYNAGATTCRWETGGAAVAKGQAGWSRWASTLAVEGTRSSPRQYGRRSIVSLDPRNLLTMKQDIIDISEVRFPRITIRRHGEAGRLQFSYARPDTIVFPFPTGTRGVFYFHHIEGDVVNSRLRFRVCRDLDQFNSGSDLLLPDGRTWSRSLQFMARKRRAYAPVLSLLLEEFPITSAQVNPSLTSRRMVTTLSPQDLVSKGQTVFDISGIRATIFTLASTQGEGQNDFALLFFSQVGKRQPFPPDTVGLLYYKQSLAYPTEIGELRFRLCSDPSLFDQGSDLASPSGDPWFCSSHELHTNITIRPLANMLYQDGLLKRPDPSLAHTLSATEHSKAPVLTRLSQPFVLNLLVHKPILAMLVDPLPDPVFFRPIFLHPRLHQQSCYRGRMLVQFEEHPDSKRSPIPARSHPIMQLRVLELLTPIVKADKTDNIARPEPGKLYSVLRDGQHVPWTYAPSGPIRKPLSDWMELSKRRNL